MRKVSLEMTSKEYMEATMMAFEELGLYITNEPSMSYPAVYDNERFWKGEDGQDFRSEFRIAFNKIIARRIKL